MAKHVFLKKKSLEKTRHTTERNRFEWIVWLMKRIEIFLMKKDVDR